MKPTDRAGKKTPVISHADRVKKSRELRGHVNIMFSRQHRDALRAIAVYEGKTLISLLNEMSERYIEAWEAKLMKSTLKSSSVTSPRRQR